MTASVFFKRVVGIGAAIVWWTLQDIWESFRALLAQLFDTVVAVVCLVATIVLGPFASFRQAWPMRHRINEKTTWRKSR